MVELAENRIKGNKKNKEKNIYKIALLILSCFVLVFLLAVSISIGAANIHLSTVWNAVFQFDSDVQAHQIIQEIRLPRSIGACLIGACLAVSGAILQGLTRNPLADSSIMGVTSGAALALIIVLVFFPALSMAEQSLASFVGAGFGVLIVFGIGTFSKGNVSPAKLALAGVAVSSLFQAITTAIALHFDMAKNMGFWYAGGLNKVNWSGVHVLFIVCIVGIAAAILISKSLTILSLGEDVSKGLGQNTLIIRAIGFIITLFLTGAAVSVAGPIGFVGLVVPHITRFLIGPDYRWIIPFSAVFGAILLVLSDAAARMVNAPFETPAGVIMAIIGVPFFLYLARGERRRA